MKRVLRIIGIIIAIIIAIFLLFLATIFGIITYKTYQFEAENKDDIEQRSELLRATEYKADTIGVSIGYLQDEQKAQRIREYFKLDTIYSKDATTWKKTIAIASFVARNIPHGNQTATPRSRDAITLWEYTQNVEPAINCRLHSILLFELLFAEGITNRFITCMPFDHNDPDCHVVNNVWIPELNKWVMIDSDFFAYVTNDQGTPLSLEEIRDGFKNNDELIVVPIHDMQVPESYYRAYLAKNLYWFSGWENSTYGVESTEHAGNYVSLVPVEYDVIEVWNKSILGTGNEGDIITTDNDKFWAEPNKLDKSIPKTLK